jgi:competence protein ComEC
VDTLVVTHPHPDHYGGVRALAAAFPVRELWDDGQAGAEDPHGAWSTTLQTLDARVLRPELLCGLPRERGGARIEVLWPCPGFDPGWDANDNSLVLRVTFGRRVLLLMGDAEAHAERALVRRGMHGPVDVLKVGHHGSRTSSTAPFLDAVAPRLAIVSAGVGNRFGHPHDDVLARLAARAALLRTDLEGGIEVVTDGEQLEARAWSGARVRLP